MKPLAVKFSFFLLGALLVCCNPTPEIPPTQTRLLPSSTATSRPAIPTPTTVPSPGITATVLGLGGYHTCALTISGGVKCWGNNLYGQLGDGTTRNSNLPMNVSLLSGGVRALAAGMTHTCALMANGGVKCWGRNSKGQLGNGTNRDSMVPVDVSDLTRGVTAITAGYRYTCALTNSGGVKCWGENISGEIGDGTTKDRNRPVDVGGLTSGVLAVDAGGGHTCALTVGGGVKYWGWNQDGQLGDGTNRDSPLPLDVEGLPAGVQAIAAGDFHTCAVMDAGSLKCWGSNAGGQLGDGTTVKSNKPVQVNSLSSGVVAVTAGGGHTCAILAGGGSKCWGDNQSGQLGNGKFQDSSLPVDVQGLASGTATLEAGYGHTCAVNVGGEIFCWGWNNNGQLGDGSIRDSKLPVDVFGWNGGVVAVAVGWSHSCALTLGGGVKCWGMSGAGRLGDGALADSGTPVDVDGLKDGVIAITVGGAHACALTLGGQVKCWGQNDRGQLGDGTTESRSTPVDVRGLTEDVIAIAAGNQHTCALLSRGAVRCWGFNEHGELGNGTRADSAKPVEVGGLYGDVTAISAGGGHTCVLTGSGGLKCWGWNNYGQLGDGTVEARLSPVNVGGLAKGVNSVGTGGFHTCVIVGGWELLCWGSNMYGQIGDSTATDRNSPVDVKWLAGIAISVAAGYDYTCGILSSGILRCWGNNEFGQLGDGTTIVRNTPVNVEGLNERVTSLTAGYYTTCVLTGRGSVKCWGNNVNGQLGNGTTTNSSVPVDVIGLGVGATP